MKLYRNLSVKVGTKTNPKSEKVEVYYDFDSDQKYCWIIKIPSQNFVSKPAAGRDGIYGSVQCWEKELKESGVKYFKKFAKVIEEYAVETRIHPPNGLPS